MVCPFSLQAFGQPTIASARAAYHCKRSGSLPLQALGRPTTASARAAYHCKRSGSLPLQALGQPTTASARAAYLVVLQCLDELLAGLEQHDPSACLCLWLSNSIPAQVVSSSFSVFSMLSSFVALSTMLRTSSSKLCRFRASRSARFVSSDTTDFTWKGCVFVEFFLGLNAD